MRITNQMLNESSRKAGIPVNNLSLLNYINTNSSGNSLLNALNNSSNAGNTIKKTSYEKLEKAADQLSQTTGVFTSEKENNVFSRARESGDKQEIYDNVEILVGNYNDTIKALRTASTPLNEFYRQMLQEAAEENGESLENIGITISRVGTAVIDRDKLEAADVDTLEQALGASSTFSRKVAILATRISDNAQAGTQSLTSQYSSAGNLYSALSNKYDFWG